ncbi:hypothetical protein Syun_008098 [Stephania yunnanensis]|uniref:Uncharacterized protein n=1 Tax=Stephania yunnanensis TaxID=152371 RepID=A0AAP0KZN2_9MAGN
MKIFLCILLAFMALTLVSLQVEAENKVNVGRRSSAKDAKASSDLPRKMAMTNVNVDDDSDGDDEKNDSYGKFGNPSGQFSDSHHYFPDDNYKPAGGH